MKYRASRTIMAACLVMWFAGCGADDDSSDRGAGTNGQSSGEECFTDFDCNAGEYCYAADPAVSPKGDCRALEASGGACVYGTHCQANLVCVKVTGVMRGACTAFPAACSDQPTCQCALGLCASEQGSSCSVGSLENPADSMTVTCSSAK